MVIMPLKEKLSTYIFFTFVIFYFIFQLFFSIEFATGNSKTPTILIEKGILQKYFVEKEIYQSLYPNLLENEHKPQRLFQTLSQEIQKNLLITIVLFVLFVLIVFLFFTMHYNISFYTIFKKQILFILLIIFLSDIFFLRRVEAYQLFRQNQNYIYFLTIFLDSIFVFFSTFFLIQKVEQVDSKSFLDLYYSKKIQFKTIFKNFINLFKDLFLISIISLLLVNLFLFPIFYLQIDLKFPFEYLFLLFLVILFFYYIYSYYKISKVKEENPKLIISFSFLSYRILTNIFYFLIILLFFLILISIIFIFIFGNLNLLEKYNLLTPKNL